MASIEESISNEEAFEKYRELENMYIDHGHIQKCLHNPEIFNDEKEGNRNPHKYVKIYPAHSHIENTADIPADEYQTYEHNLNLISSNRLKNLQQKLLSHPQVQTISPTQEIFVAAKSNIRDQELENIERDLYTAMKPEIEEKIYSEKFENIKENIHKDLHSKARQEILTFKIEEMENLNENLKNINTEGIENKIRNEMKQIYEDKLNVELLQKEKEIHTMFLKKLNVFKTNYEKQMNAEFEEKKKALLKQINEEKCRNYSSTCAERLKKKKKKDAKNKVLCQSASAEDLHHRKKMMDIQELLDKSLNKRLHQEEIVGEACEPRKPKQSVSINPPSKVIEVNLQRVNNELKSLHNINVQSGDAVAKEVPLIMKDNQTKIIPEGSNHSHSHSHVTATSQKSINSLRSYENNNPEKKPPIKYECISLKIEELTPISMKEFGKFIISYINVEESMRLFLENNLKKFALAIKKKFHMERRSDHCLLDYLIEMWEKLHVSYQRRYTILSEMTKKSTGEVYYVLDNETDILTDYSKKSERIYDYIKKREKLKTQVQIKANRGMLLKSDLEKLKSITTDLARMIGHFKKKFNINIMWRGLAYEWIINYENWMASK